MFRHVFCGFRGVDSVDLMFRHQNKPLLPVAPAKTNRMYLKIRGGFSMSYTVIYQCLSKDNPKNT